MSDKHIDAFEDEAKAEIEFLCQSCHKKHEDLERENPQAHRERRQFFMRRGMMRTINRLIEMELVRI